MAESGASSADSSSLGLAAALFAMLPLIMRELARARGSCSSNCRGSCGGAVGCKAECSCHDPQNTEGLRVQVGSSTPSALSSRDSSAAAAWGGRRQRSGSRSSSSSSHAATSAPSPGSIGSLLPSLRMPPSPAVMDASSLASSSAPATPSRGSRPPTPRTASHPEGGDPRHAPPAAITPAPSATLSPDGSPMNVGAGQLDSLGAAAAADAAVQLLDFYDDVDGVSEKKDEVIVVIDIGSTSIKCSAFVVKCEACGGSRRVRELHFAAQRFPSPPFTEQGYIADARAVRVQVEAALDACLDKIRAAGFDRVAKIGFSSLVMNMFGLDLLGQPVTPVFTYASSEPQHAHFNPSFQERFDHHALTGTAMHHPSYALVQLKAFYDRFPDTAASVHHWTTLSSYIIGCWTSTFNATTTSVNRMTSPAGHVATSSVDGAVEFCPVSYSEASWTGLFKTDDLAWCDKALHYLPALRSSSLPKLADFDGYAGQVTDQAAERWPELRGCRFHLGVGDGAAANLGSTEQCRAAGYAADACVSIGTSAAVRVLIDSRASSEVSPPVPMGLWCYRVDRTRCLVGGALTDGGSLVEWFGHCFGEAALRETLAEVEDVVLRQQCSEDWKPTPGSDHLYVLPFWSGERSTGWHTHASGHIAGITRSTGRADLLTGLLEGLCVRLWEILRLLAKSGVLERRRSARRHSTSTSTSTTIGHSDSVAAEQHQQSGTVEEDANNEDEDEEEDRLFTLGASGGALTSCPALCQMLADVTGMRVAVQGQRPSPQSSSSSSSSSSSVVNVASAQSSHCTESTTLGVALLLASAPDTGADGHGGVNADTDDTTSSTSTTALPVTAAAVVVRAAAEGLHTAVYLPRAHMTRLYARRVRKHHFVYDNNMPAAT